MSTALPPAPTLGDIDIVVPIFVGIALSMTAFRLIDRVSHKRGGWDDVICALAACFMIAYTCAFFLFLQPPAGMSQQAKVSAFYVAGTCFHGVVWMVRVSLTFTLIRIAAWRSQRRWLYALAFLFTGLMLFLWGQYFWICEREPNWKALNPPICALPQSRAVTELAFDIFADLALLIIPLHLLSRVTLERSTRIRLLFVFSTSLIITVVSVVQDVVVFISGGLRQMLAASLEDAFALMVCNMAVVVTSIHRSVSKSSGGQLNGSSTSAPSKPEPYAFSQTSPSGRGDEVLDIYTADSERFQQPFSRHELRFDPNGAIPLTEIHMKSDDLSVPGSLAPSETDLPLVHPPQPS